MYNLVGIEKVAFALIIKYIIFSFKMSDMNSNFSNASPMQRKNSIKGAPGPTRQFFVHNQELNEPLKFANNYIKTTRYNKWNFFPVCLFRQFLRIANIYFLFICILQSIPQISPISAITAIGPLVVVLGLSMLREGWEDFQRYKSDKSINATKFKRLLSNNSYETIRSDEITVGDILLIENEETFPADLILLASCMEKGVCYIQTGSLDGEKNLKPRRIPKMFEKIVPQGDMNTPELNALKELKTVVDTEGPSQDLYQFVGKMEVNGEQIPLDTNQMLLMGANLMNTKWVIGFACFTGTDTRLMQNSEDPRTKMSTLEKKLNAYVVWIFVIQIIMSTIIAILSSTWYNGAKNEHIYLPFDQVFTIHGLLTFFTYVLLLNTLLPISLFVSLEFVKVLQANFVNKDARMYCLERDKPAWVSNSAIIEELGQINYVFSDKTGTLTKNVMTPMSICIGMETFGEQIQMDFDLEKDLDKITHKMQSMDKSVAGKSFNKSTFNQFMNGNKQKDVQVKLQPKAEAKVLTNQKQMMTEFMKTLSIAHECVIENKVTENSDGTKTSKKDFQGPSPDEVALVQFANELGFSFIDGSDNHVDLRMRTKNFQEDLISKEKTETPKEFRENNPQEEKTEYLDVKFQVVRKMEFNSDRKRMSVLVRDPTDDTFKLYVKGADSIIMERLNMDLVDKAQYEYTLDFINGASKNGLRTLLIGMRVLDGVEVAKFLTQCAVAEADIHRREALLTEVYSRLETNFQLLGATAVEDKLQDKVPETIKDLQTAGIKVWMLTGDKFETAENIGFSCRLINDQMHIYRINTLEDVQKVCNKQMCAYDESLMLANKKRGLIVEASALTLILAEIEYRHAFIKIAKGCEGVICCRVSPAQKADVVKMIIKDDESVISLAIGDGANDVSMIREAHIGVGLYGNEGMRAVQASDVALGEFRFLWRLLLVHGRLAYLRNAEMILYFFYKNIVMTMPHFLYAFLNGFSGQTIFDDWYIASYNMVFTAAPLVNKACLEWDINHLIDGRDFKPYIPLLYNVGPERQIFNNRNFFYWEMLGAAHAFVCFYIPMTTFQGSGVFLGSDGSSHDMWTLSVCSFTAIMLVVNLKLMVTTRYSTYLNFISIFPGSIFLYYAYMWVTNYMEFSGTIASIVPLHESPLFYLCLIVCVGLCFICDLFMESYKVNFRTNPTDLLRQIARNGESIRDPKNLARLKEILDKKVMKSNKTEFKRSRTLESHRNQVATLLPRYSLRHSQSLRRGSTNFALQNQIFDSSFTRGMSKSLRVSKKASDFDKMHSQSAQSRKEAGISQKSVSIISREESPITRSVPHQSRKFEHNFGNSPGDIQLQELEDIQVCSPPPPPETIINKGASELPPIAQA